MLKKVAKLCEGKTVLINHDSDHNKDNVLKDLLNYASFVSPNSYFIVEDTLVDLLDEPMKATIQEGPLMAIKDFLQINHDFIIDEECERYILTNNPSGYLKCIK